MLNPVQMRPGSERKLYVYKLARRWYVKCNECVTRHRRVVIASSGTFYDTLESGRRHAALYHGVVI